MTQTYLSDTHRAELIAQLAAHPQGKSAETYSDWSNGQLSNEACYLGIWSL